jgi:hypothetical protein
VTSSYYLKPFDKHGLVDMRRGAGTIITEKGKDFLEWIDEEKSEEEGDGEGGKTTASESSQSNEMSKEKLLDKVNISDKDYDVAVLAFEKIINRKDNDFVSFHLFEQHFQGDNIRPMRFYQKMFSNPELVQKLLDSVGVENDWAWTKKQDFKDGMKNWVIELK